MGALLGFMLCVATATVSADVPSADVQTRHYDLHVEVLDADEVGRMLEQAYERMEQFFGKAPSERLRLELHAKPTRLREVLKAEGVSLNGVGGYYSPRRKKAILFVQPSDYATRHLILHEALHQFHFLAVTDNRSPGCFWYVEGLAEYFAMHNWDGKKLHVGVVPSLTLEDYPAQARKQVTKHQADLHGLIHGTWGNRPEAWSLIHYLVNNEPRRFRELSQQLDRRIAPADAWRQVFGPVSAKQTAAWQQWIETHQQPWQIVWISFQELGDVLEGKAQSNGIAVLKLSPARLDVELELVSGRLRAGLVFGYQSPDEFRLWQILADNTVRLVDRKNGKWKIGPTFPLPRRKELPRLAVVQSNHTVALYANEVKLTTVSASGQVGLNVDGCRVRFRVSDNPKAGSVKGTEVK